MNGTYYPLPETFEMKNKQLKPEEEPGSLRDRLINLFNSTKDPLTQKHFEEHFSNVPLSEMLPILNKMQKEGMLDVLVSSDRSLSWQLRPLTGSEAALRSLSDVEEKLVYNCIRKANSEGITLKLISMETKLPQNRLPKILKGLLSKKLIKELVLSTGQKHKVYMLIDVEPSQKIATSSLFAGESGVDSEFVNVLETACLRFLKHKLVSIESIADPLKLKTASYCSLYEIHKFIMDSKISTVKMTSDDLRLVLDSLTFGGELECKIIADTETIKVEPSEQTVVAPSTILYRLASEYPSLYGLATIPCTVCNLRKDCKPGGFISPINCELFNNFLDF